MDPIEKQTVQTRLLDRFRKSWFPPAAVVGALASFVAAAFRIRPEPKVAPRPASPVAPPKPMMQPANTPQTPGRFEREYSLTSILGGGTSAHPFRRSLAGIAVGTGDRIYALGDDEVRIFGPGGDFIQSWKVSAGAACLAVAPDNRVYVGFSGRVEIYSAQGISAGGFAVGEKDKPAAITAVKIFNNEILVADAAARFIRRYDMSGKQLGLIGTQNKTGNFMLPNGWLDFDVDAKGVIRATDTGRHLVTSWDLDGRPLSSFGKFGMTHPVDFVGCCNPVNLALTPEGKIVTGEKMIARVKVYEPDGKLIAVIGPEHFDPNCVHIHLAVDSKGRILAADPVRREVKIFSLVVRVGVNLRSLVDSSPKELEAI